MIHAAAKQNYPYSRLGRKALANECHCGYEDGLETNMDSSLHDTMKGYFLLDCFRYSQLLKNCAPLGEFGKIQILFHPCPL